jgi:hypothetical protein
MILQLSLYKSRHAVSFPIEKQTTIDAMAIKRGIIMFIRLIKIIAKDIFLFNAANNVIFFKQTREI